MMHLLDIFYTLLETNKELHVDMYDDGLVSMWSEDSSYFAEGTSKTT